MDRPTSVQLDPDTVLPVDRLGRADRAEEIAPEGLVVEPLQEGAAELRGRVREAVARHLARVERGDECGQRLA